MAIASRVTVSTQVLGATSGTGASPSPSPSPSTIYTFIGTAANPAGTGSPGSVVLHDSFGPNNPKYTLWLQPGQTLILPLHGSEFQTGIYLQLLDGATEASVEWG